MGQGFTSHCGGGGYGGCDASFIIFLILILLLLGTPTPHYGGCSVEK